MALIISTVAAMLIGWIAGMWTRKRAEHWCPVDGATLRCPECAKATQPAAQPTNNAELTTEVAMPLSTVDGAA